MPLPLDSFPDSSVIAENLIIENYPPSNEVLSIAYKLISGWASVEKRQLDFIIRMLEGSSSVAASAYLSLNGAGPKMAFLRGAAKAALSEIEMEYLECTLEASKPIMKFRNKLAHWSIVQVEGHSDNLVLQNPIVNVSEVRTDNEGVFVFSFDEIKLHTEKTHLLWQCYHYLMTIYSLARFNADKQKELELRYVELREKLSSIDNQLQVPQFPQVPP